MLPFVPPKQGCGLPHRDIWHTPLQNPPGAHLYGAGTLRVFNNFHTAKARAHLQSKSPRAQVYFRVGFYFPNLSGFASKKGWSRFITFPPEIPHEGKPWWPHGAPQPLQHQPCAPLPECPGCLAWGCSHPTAGASEAPG